MDQSKSAGRFEELAKAGKSASPPLDVVADFVRLNRNLRQWKQETLASFANVSLSTVERIERGEAVSKQSLERVAVALGYHVGDFTDPRVPLTQKEAAKKAQESVTQFADKVAVPVRLLRTQDQVADLARCHTYLIDGGRIESSFDADLEELREWLDLTAFVLEENDRRERTRRRTLYGDVLNAIGSIEQKSYSIALAGTYLAKSNMPVLPDVKVALISFFPKRTDPGAAKRKILLAPQTIDLKAAWAAFSKGS